MKTKNITLLALLFVAGNLGLAVAAGPNNFNGGNGASNAFSNRPGAQKNLQLAALSADEENDLRWMREEEKLALDVYRGLYDRWRDPVFNQIARSEQRHFDTLGAKISLYRLVDPALPYAGQFANTELQMLYLTLMNQGGLSLIDALKVGATIEDLDIRDLLEAIETTTSPALKTSYGNLLEGSKNHLRAFVARLQLLGGDYVPQYIDAVLYDTILGL